VIPPQPRLKESRSNEEVDRFLRRSDWATIGWHCKRIPRAGGAALSDR
jgi:hypothetical protein